MAVDLREQELVPVVGAVDVARPELRGETVPVPVEQKQRVVADRLEVPVVGAAFLLSMHGTLTGVHVEHDAVGVVHAFGLREQVPVQSHQPNEISLTGEQLGLEPMQGRRQGRSSVPPLR